MNERTKKIVAKRGVAAMFKNNQKKSGQEKARPAGTVLVERLFRPGGSRERVLSLDANSATFTQDLTLLFERNVAKAQRERKRKAGSSDRAGKQT